MKGSVIRALALLAMMVPMSSVLSADQAVNMSGTLKYAKRTTKDQKTYVQFFLVSDSGKKTLLSFNLKNSNDKPKMKDYVNKKVRMTGAGSTKVIRGVPYVILTSVTFDLLDKEEAAPAVTDEAKPIELTE